MNKQYRLKGTSNWSDFYIGDVSRYDVRDRLPAEYDIANLQNRDRVIKNTVNNILLEINNLLLSLQIELEKLK